MEKSNKPKKILCSRADCGGVIAHAYADNMIGIKRAQHLVQCIGNDWAIILTCPKISREPAVMCNVQTSIVCEEGKINFDKLNIFKEEDDPEKDAKLEPEQDKDADASNNLDIKKDGKKKQE